MANKYADRAFISINGTPVIDLQSAQLKRNRNAREVSTMSRDGFNKGFVQGNTVVDITVTLPIRNRDPRPKFDSIDYETSNVSLTFVCGAEQFICNDLFLKDNDDNAGGVGDEVKSTFNFGALKVVDAVGNGVLFDIEL